MDYEIIKIDEQTWRIENNGVRFFVVAGNDRAVLIDSGMTTKNARELAEGLCDKPLVLVNTHADMDHIAGNADFDYAMMNPAEYINYRGGAVSPLWDGDILDLGGRSLRVITLPGHTPGSIALLDQSRRVLFGGDPIQDGRIFMFGAMRNMQAYVHSLQKLQKYSDEFDTVYPSHGSFPVSADIIPKLIEGAERVLSGELTPTVVDFHGRKISVYDFGTAAFLGEAEE